MPVSESAMPPGPRRQPILERGGRTIRNHQTSCLGTLVPIARARQVGADPRLLALESPVLQVVGVRVRRELSRPGRLLCLGNRVVPHYSGADGVGEPGRGTGAGEGDGGVFGQCRQSAA